ncbi:RNA methyltransferase tRNA(m5U54)methyltransferase [Lithohypha guttulata]|uniref:RNA methyltransferase tRNA(m5U54)methyltransferase n=1 Tax=Lithohypha guttulata TaxID=1690604 RepID=UPI002DDE4397|nr:RNA methyltransferase tRNA(m5U54)methyltransferase [Lithohypha guttulata]KAK5105276.1 RNA methyltransferase tRNA(m5U54)methyltransferase [Lithohypha guttulata]
MADSDTPITINERMYRTVKEGAASILAPYSRDKEAKKSQVAQSRQPRNNDEGNQAVFYNPIQQYNRDLSVLAILVYGESAIAIKKAKHAKNVNRSNKKKQKTSATLQPVPGTAEFSTDKGIPVSNESTATKRKADNAGLDDSTDKFNTKRACIDNGVDKQRDEGHGTTTSGHTGHADHQSTSGSLAQAVPPKTSPEKRPYQTPFAILDALSASGLRAIRYAKEIPFATTVVANDLLTEAVEAIKLNIEHNKLQGKVFSNVGDARQFMYSKTGNEVVDPKPGYVHKFDVVDLDPYGTAAPFIDAALQAVVDGGMLCVTCTDAGVWASNGYPEKAYALYGGISLKGSHSHEAGLRLILHSIATAAAKYGLAVEPLLSLSIDFYGRMFVRVHKSQQDVKLLAGTTMVVYNCDQGCGAWHTQLVGRNQEKKAKNNEPYFKHGFAQAPSVDKYCKHCGTKMHLGGPMWAGPLHNPVFVQKILDKLTTADKTMYGTTERIKGMLTVALEEEDIGWPVKLTHKAAEQSSHVPHTNRGPQVQTDDLDTNASALIARMPPSLLSPAPLFFLPTYLAKVLAMPTPAEDPLRGAFLSLGYTCTRSHCKPGSFKTDAPWEVIWEIAREWARQMENEILPRLFGEGEYTDKGSVKKSSPGWNILRRIRGRYSDSLLAVKTRERLLEQLGLGQNSTAVDSVLDLQSILKSALYDLGHRSRQQSFTTNGCIDSSRSHSTVQDTRVPGTITSAESNGSIRGSPPNHNVSSMSNDQNSSMTGKSLIENGVDPSELNVVFDARLGRAFRESGGKLVRYQMNPRANWGPMVRAGSGT